MGWKKGCWNKVLKGGSIFGKKVGTLKKTGASDPIANYDIWSFFGKTDD